MAELKKYQADLQYQATPIGGGGARYYGTLAEKLSQFADYTRGKYEQGITQQASDAALEAVQEGNFSTKEDASRFGQQYDKVVREAFNSQIANDLRVKVSELATQNQDDPVAFKNAFDGYMEGMKGQFTDPKMRFILDNTAQGTFAPMFSKIKSNAIQRNLKEAQDANLERLEGEAETILSRIEMGDPHTAQLEDLTANLIASFSQMQDVLPPGFDVRAAAESLRDRAIMATAYGDLRQQIESGDMQSMIDTREAYNKQDFSGILTMDQKDQMISRMDAMIADKARIQKIENAEMARAESEDRDIQRKEVFNSVDTGEATYESLYTAWENDVLTRPELEKYTARMTDARDKAVEKQDTIARMSNAVANGIKLPSSEQKNIDLYYADVMSDDAQTNLDLAVSIAKSTNLVPSNIANFIELNSSNITEPATMVIAANALRDLQDNAPVAYANMKDDVKAFGSIVIRMQDSGVPLDRIQEIAFHNVYELSDEEKDRYDRLSGIYLSDKDTKDELREEIQSGFGDVDWAWWTPDIEVPNYVMAKADYLFKDYMRSTGGDVKAAKELTVNAITNGREFGYSMAGKTIMMNPPEKEGNYVPSKVKNAPVNDEWTREQFEQDMKELGLDPDEVQIGIAPPEMYIGDGGYPEYVLYESDGTVMVDDNFQPIIIQFNKDEYDQPFLKKQIKEAKQEAKRKARGRFDQEKHEEELKALKRYQEWSAGAGFDYEGWAERREKELVESRKERRKAIREQ